jgi:hypothetical protein
MSMVYHNAFELLGTSRLNLDFGAAGGFSTEAMPQPHIKGGIEFPDM